MYECRIPPSYHPVLNAYDTQCAIMYIKQVFQEEFAAALNLKRVSAPLFVTADSGLNDDLSGCERPVTFEIPAMGKQAQIVHSLAKWKRLALKRYGFTVGNGIYADMNAVRADETPDNLHSVYVDQWDWEKVITGQDRNLDYLRETVKEIVQVICDTYRRLQVRYPQLQGSLNPDVSFITAQELEDQYPGLDAREREKAYVQARKTACVLQIGGALRSGKPHDNRAPDYDDWNLNCDLFFWDDVLDVPMEVSSMGIRVDAETLDCQLTASGCDDRRRFPFHKMLLSGELPLTIGGGIGQSRLCMLMLRCAHIGEVQSSIWDDATVAACAAAGIPLL